MHGIYPGNRIDFTFTKVLGLKLGNVKFAWPLLGLGWPMLGHGVTFSRSWNEFTFILVICRVLLPLLLGLVSLPPPPPPPPPLSLKLEED